MAMTATTISCLGLDVEISVTNIHKFVINMTMNLVLLEAVTALISWNSAEELPQASPPAMQAHAHAAEMPPKEGLLFAQ